MKINSKHYYMWCLYVVTITTVEKKVLFRSLVTKNTQLRIVFKLMK